MLDRGNWTEGIGDLQLGIGVWGLGFGIWAMVYSSHNNYFISADGSKNYQSFQRHSPSAPQPPVSSDNPAFQLH